MASTIPGVSFVSLLLILGVSVVPIRGGSHGLKVNVAMADARALDSCGDARTVLVILKADHSLWINSEAEPTLSRLRERLVDIFKTRAERIIFLQAGSDVSFGEVATVLDAIRPTADVVSLITR